MKILKSLILLFFIFSVKHALCQNRMIFDHITQNDGLPSDHVNQILQDSDGLMWFATYNGLASYDGYSFNTYNYNPADSTTINHDFVISMCEESSRYIWIVTTNGVCRFDKEQCIFKRFSSTKECLLSRSGLRKIKIDSKGNLWMATNAGFIVYNIQNEKIDCYYSDENNPNSLSSNSVNDIYIDKNSNVWVATDKGLDLFDRELESFTRIKDGYFLRLIKYNAGIMAITRDFIRYITPSVDDIDFSKVILEGIKDNWVVTDVLINYQGADWYTIRDVGTLCFNKENRSYTIYKYDKYDKKSINSNVPQCIYKDNNDNLWIGTFDGGINFYSPHKKKFINIQDNFKKDGLQNNNVKTIYEDIDGDIWVGTKVGGMLSKFDKTTQTFMHFKHDPDDPSSISDDYIFTIADAQPGYLWVGTMNGGLNLFNKKTGECIHFKHDPDNESSISTNNIRSLFVDRGKLWIGGHRKGIDAFDINSRKRIKNYRFSIEDSTISSNNVTCIIRDFNGRLWFGTRFGLNRYDSKMDQFVRYYHNDNDSTGLSDNMIQCIVEDSDHYLWMGTKNGLNRYDPATDSFQVFNTNTGLPTNSVYGLSIDSNGILWMSTNLGIVKFNYKTNESVLYTDEDGLGNNEFVPSVYTTSKEGEVFFGGNKGFTFFKPDDIVTNPYSPNIVFTDFKVLNKSVKPANDNLILSKHINKADEVNLYHNDDVFSIDFSALNYVSSDKNEYAYRLEGFDKDWHYCNNSHSATYTNLNPGKYIFKVIASNNDGVWNKTGRSLQINVIPPWWNTLLFKIVVILFLIFIVLFLFRFKQNIYRIRTSVLEEKVKERTENLNKANLELNAQKEEIINQRNEIQDKKEQLEKETQRFAVLNEFGQELINILSLTEINRVIFDYVKTLLDVPIFGIAIYNQEEDCLELPSYFEEGHAVKSFSISLDSQNSLAVWCYKHQEVIFSNDFKSDYLKYVDVYYFPNSVMPESVMYLALTVKGKKIGVMFVQSYKLNAYTQNDLVTLQTLASYVAIALDNANAYRIVSSQNKELEQQHLWLEHQVKVRTRELEAAKLKAEESDRLKTSFLANMSHEIRTPLNAIVGFSECLSLQDLDQQEKENMAGIIKVNSDSLLQIISDIIDFSKIEAGQMSISKSNVDVDNLLEEINNTYLFQLNTTGKKVKLQMNTVKDGLNTKPVLYTDPYRLKQIFINLIDNAIKFTEDGKIEFGYKEVKDGSLVFYVKDTGIGIARENLNVIFDRFRKIEDDNSVLYRGTGLGLSIIKYLTELLDGEIWVESEVGKGSEFGFMLPELIIEDVEDENVQAVSEKLLPDWSNKKILVVEDEESNYLLLEQILKITNVNIIWAKDGLEAVVLFKENIDKIDLVLLDIKLPVKDGFEVVKEMKQENSNIPVIAQTAFAMAYEEHIIRDSGFDDYISKPLNKKQLYKKMLVLMS